MTGKTKNILIISITFVILAAIFVIMILGNRIPMNEDSAVGNTPGNLNNGGYFCEADGVVYFANAYDNYALYSMTP